MDRRHPPRIARNTFIAWLAILPALAAAEPVLDASFGNAGVVDVPLPVETNYTRPYVAVLPDRRIVVARVVPGSTDMATPATASFVRILPDGRLDPGFGTGGIARLALGAQPVTDATPLRLHARADGSVLFLTALRTIGPDAATSSNELVLVRVAPDGRSDPTFNGGVPARMPHAGYSRFHLFDADAGPLVVAHVDGRCCGEATPLTAWRFRADGTPDASFGTGGVLDLPSPAASIRDVMPVPGGGFQTLTEAAAGDGIRRFWRRYRANGSLDSSFGTGGDEDIASIGGSDYLQILPLGDGTWLGTDPAACARRFLDAQGRTVDVSTGDCPIELRNAGINVEAHAWGDRILMSGTQHIGPITLPSDGAYLWAIDRAGRVDAEFAHPQVVRWRQMPWASLRHDVAVDGPQGFVVASAEFGSDAVRVQRFIAPRGTTQTQPVPALGLPGLLLVVAGTAALAGRRLRRRDRSAMRIQQPPDTSSEFTMWKAILVLALALPCAARAALTPDTGFGNAGIVDLALPGQRNAGTTHTAVLPDRRVVVAAVRGNPRPFWTIQPLLWLARLQPDGSLDPTFGNGAPATLELAQAELQFVRFNDVHVRNDGSLYALVTLSSSVGHRTILVSVTADGRFDPAFNAGAPLVVAPHAYENPKVFDTGSGYLVVGVGRLGTFGVRLGFDAWRVRADGSPDIAFGGGGSIVVPGSGEGIGSTDVMPVPGGGFQILNYQQSEAVPNYWRRYRADGSLDTAFGDGGVEAIPNVDSPDDVIRDVYPLGDGTYAAVAGASCVQRTFDAHGRTLSTFSGLCIGGATSNPNVQPYGEKLLANAGQYFPGTPSPADGTWLWVLDRNGAIDRAFAEPQGDRWRSPTDPNADYSVGADGDRGVVLASAGENSMRVLRYLDVRRGASDQPIPALGLPALLLLSACAAGLARRRFAVR